MPARGSPGPSSCASGCLATKSSSAWTSRPSLPCQSTVTVPPESPNPRESQVSTLKPALRSAAAPTLPVDSLVAPSPVASRVPPQPCVMRMVGARSPAGGPGRDGTR